MRQRSVILLILSLGVALNGIGYAVYRGLRARPALSQVEPEAAAAAGPSAEQREADERGRARRAEGLAALEAGDYDRALASFVEAQTSMGERANVGELLRITQDLQVRAAAAKAASAASSKSAAQVELPPARPAPPRPAPQKPAPRPLVLALRAAPLGSPAEAKPAEAAGPSSGILLISTTPRGLLVQLDGAPLDLTPVRATVRAGAHKVSLYDGERKVLETSVEVAEGEVATLRRDLTAEVTPPAAQRPSALLPAAATQLEPSAPASAPVALRKAAPEPPTPAVAAPTAAPERGGLDITSPGLYAEVWINGRSYGFPPVAARNLPAGTAEVEVRVNGAVKRKAKAVVQPGQVTAIKVR